MEMNKEKIKLGIIFGGRSSEHEISILSAASVMDEIDRSRYEVVPFGITKRGEWRLVEPDTRGLVSLEDARIIKMFENAKPVTLADFDAMTDFAFPVLHGPFGEDGTIQGLFEMLGKPYAGCGVAAAAISMDKIFTKELWIREGLPVCDHSFTTRAIVDRAGDMATGLKAEADRIERELDYPIFVKPANMGSSVGVTKVSNAKELADAIELALRYDKRVICEQMVVGRELEVGVIGNGEPLVSAVGEILSESEYYDYDSKYRGGGTKLSIPANLPLEVVREIENLAKRAYTALGGEGFARIDLFYNELKGQVLLSEMNAIPGFTKYSMFPLLWGAKGVSYAELIERIIGLGHERHHAAHRR